jgi:hypothetical protein
MLAFQSEFEIINEWTNVKVLPANLTFKKIKLLRLLLFLCKYMICERGIEALPKPASNAHFEMRKERKTKKTLSNFTYHRHWQQRRHLHPHPH